MPTIKELQDEARGLGCTGYSKLKKAELELFVKNCKSNISVSVSPKKVSVSPKKVSVSPKKVSVPVSPKKVSVSVSVSPKKVSSVARPWIETPPVWSELNVSQQASIIFPTNIIQSWVDVVLLPETIELLQGILMSMVRRWMLISNVACEYKQMNVPCLTRGLGYFQFSKEQLSKVAKVMQTEERGDLDTRLLELYFDAHKWEDVSGLESMVAVFFTLIKAITHGWTSRMTVDDVLTKWRASTSLKPLINEILV